MIWGCDISTYQESSDIPGYVDFSKMRLAGARFVIVKAGQGNWRDPDFPTNWAGARDVLPRHSYWFYDNHFPPKDQARKYREVAQADPEGMCWLDLEDKSAGMYGGWRNWYDFICELQLLDPAARIGIYTGFYYWTEFMRYAKPLELEYFGQFPLWLAWYFDDPFHPDYTRVMVPPPWEEYLILQSGTPAIGHTVGVESLEVDFDIFQGDENKFTGYFCGDVPQEGQTMYRYEAISAYRMSIRPEPNVNNTPITSLPAQTKMQGDVLQGAQGSGECWLNVQATEYATMAISGWVAVEHDGRVYCALTDRGAQEPAEAPPDWIEAHWVSGAMKKYVPE